LTGENRIFVTTGLQRLNTTLRPGLVALKNVAQVTGPIGGYEVGFQLAPRLNAAGRMETAAQALELLLARSAEIADPLARELDARNRERQQIERGIAEEVIAPCAPDSTPRPITLLSKANYSGTLRRRHRRCAGLARVSSADDHPGGDGDEWRGSGRSIEGFNLAAALRQCDDLLPAPRRPRDGGRSVHASAEYRRLAPPTR